jgi:hypothetical protein
MVPEFSNFRDGDLSIRRMLKTEHCQQYLIIAISVPAGKYSANPCCGKGNIISRTVIKDGQLR